MNRSEPFAAPDAELQEFGSGLRCLLQAPTRAAHDAPVLVAVHGISRNAQDHFDAFAPLAAAAGWLLVAPLFDAETFPDYQRLGRPGKGERADLFLLALLAQLASQYAVRDRALHLFGHSGGAQFVHRFVMAHPERVARYAISAPGWYTFPDAALNYPRGLAYAPIDTGLQPPQAFLKVPGCVFVGNRDCRRGPNVRRTAPLDADQGMHRLERAQRWTAAMNAQARTLGLAEPMQLQQLPDAGHSFKGLVRRADLNRHAWRFLSASNGAAR